MKIIKYKYAIINNNYIQLRMKSGSFYYLSDIVIENPVINIKEKILTITGMEQKHKFEMYSETDRELLDEQSFELKSCWFSNKKRRIRKKWVTLKERKPFKRMYSKWTLDFNDENES